MNRIDPEIFDIHRRHAAFLRQAAIRRWQPLAWLLDGGRGLLEHIARYATTRPSQH